MALGAVADPRALVAGLVRPLVPPCRPRRRAAAGVADYPTAPAARASPPLLAEARGRGGAGDTLGVVRAFAVALVVLPRPVVLGPVGPLEAACRGPHADVSPREGELNSRKTTLK